MKSATPELIALLDDNGKQLVMWDTYRITLANGTVLTYSTRDQDCPAPAYVPPPSPGSQSLLDTFTGFGTLATHVGEAGANWMTANPDREDDLAQFVVGGGLLTTTENFYLNGVFATQWVPDGIDSSLFMSSNLALKQYGSVRMLAADANLAARAEITARVDNTANGPRVFFDQVIESMTGNSVSDSFETSVGEDVFFEVRMELTDARSVVTAYLNNVPVMTSNLPPGDTVGGLTTTYFGLLNASFSYQTPTVSEVRGGPLVGFVLDTFTGPDTQSLATHVGEAGAEWSVPSGADPSPPTSAASLTGNGAVFLSNSYSNQKFTASGDAPVDDTPFFVEMDVDFAAEGYNGQIIGVGVCNEDLSRFIEAQVFVFASSPTADLLYWNGSGYTEGVVDLTGILVPYVVNTLRLEISNDRQTAVMKINGAEVTTLDFTGTPLPAMPRPMISFGSTGFSRQVLRIAGDTL